MIALVICSSRSDCTVTNPAQLRRHQHPAAASSRLSSSPDSYSPYPRIESRMRALGAEPRVACCRTTLAVLPRCRFSTRRHLRHGGPRCRPAAATYTATEQLVPTPGSTLEGSNPQPQAQKLQQQQFDWHRAWYPIAFAKDLDKSKLARFMLLDTPLVVWWDANAGAWSVLKDECPHRLVPLSEGRVNRAGHIECGYHGWTFNGHGACQAIPQGGDPSSPRACATLYACEERQGLLFVWGEPLALGRSGNGNGSGALPDPALIITVPELEDPDWVPQDTWRDLPYDATVLMENVLDSSHVPFTHHKSMSNRNILGAYDMELLEPLTVKGFGGVWKTGPRAGALGSQTTEFRPPFYMKHKLQSPRIDSIVVVYAVPMGPGRCRLINRNVVRPKGGASVVGKVLRVLPGWASHLGTQVLLEDDQIFLHYGELELARRKAQGQLIGQAYFTPSPADTFVLSLHRWLDKFGGGGPWGPVDGAYVDRLGPRLSREQLLDRFSQHTANCAQCQRGLAQVTGAREVLRGVERVLAAAALLCAATAVAIASVAGGGGAAAVGPGASLAFPASLLLSALQLVVGGPQPSVEDLLVRGGAFGVAAAAAGFVSAKVQELIGMFHKGSYPPPRNLASD